MSKCNLILTGSGYLSNAIISHHSELNSNYNLVEISRTRKNRSVKIKSVQLDIDNIGEVESFFDNSKIVYMAPPDNSSDKDIRSEKFIAAIKRFTVKKIIYISTSGVYGNCNGKIVSELQKVNPITERARRRVSAENQFIRYGVNNNVDVVILRVPGIYGKTRLPIRRIESREPLIKIEESRTTNLIHVEDLSRLTIKALNIDVKSNEIINVSDGTAIKTTKYYQLIYKALGKELPEYISYEEALKIYDDKRLSFLKESRILDVSKMHKLLPDCIKYKRVEDGIKASL